VPLELERIARQASGELPLERVRGAVESWLDHELPGEPAWLTRSRELYAEQHLARSLEAIALIPRPAARGRLLELGSGLYLMTFLLEALCDYELELVQYWQCPGGQYESVLVHRRSGARKVFPFREFNAEHDRFPYPDASFDVIVNCEMIEHLLCDPVHMLAECHRVLRPGGALVLTTPNVLRLENVVRLLRGANIHDKYVRESAGARHPREYTPAEMKMLLEWTGFEVPHLETRDVTAGGVGPRARRLARWCLGAFALAGQLAGRGGQSPAQGRGEQILALARRAHRVNPEPPEFLFQRFEYGKITSALHGARG
jgi:SAM-dependent methyltransferase